MQHLGHPRHRAKEDTVTLVTATPVRPIHQALDTAPDHESGPKRGTFGDAAVKAVPRNVAGIETLVAPEAPGAVQA